MADIAPVEEAVAKPSDAMVTKEALKPTLMMRWADAGDPTTLYLKGNVREIILNTRTGIRKEQNPEAPVTPEFTEPLPIGAILNLGEGQTFIIASPSKATDQEQFKNSVFVKRIPLENGVDEKGSPVEGFKTLSQRFEKEDQRYMVYSEENGNLPFTRKTFNKLQDTKLP